MKEDLQQRVDRWQQPSTLMETRTVTENPSPVAHGELLLYLRMDLNIEVGNATEHIVVTNRFLTAQNNQVGNSSGDCYRFERESNALSQLLFDRYEETLTKLIDDQFGNGFVPLNSQN